MRGTRRGGRDRRRGSARRRGNGWLVDFFDAAKLAGEIASVLDADTRERRERARATVVERYGLRRVCLPQHFRALGV